MYGYSKFCLFARRCCLNICNASLLVRWKWGQQWEAWSLVLNTLKKQIQTKHTNDKNAFTFHSRLINLPNIKFSKEQISTLTLGPNYSLQKEPIQCINELIIRKVKWSRYRPGVAQRVGKVIAVLFHDRGTRRGWVVSSTSQPHLAPGKSWYSSRRRLIGPKAGLDGRKISSRTIQPVINRYTEWATRPTTN